MLKTNLEYYRTYQKRKWDKLRTEGRCGRCGALLEDDTHSRCLKCRIDANTSAKKYYDKNKYRISEKRMRMYYKRLSDGICVSCGKEPASPGITRCLACAERQYIAGIKSYNKRKEQRSESDHGKASE